MGSGRKRLPSDGSLPADAFLEAGRVVAVHGTAGRIRVKAMSGDPAGLLGAVSLRLYGKAARGSGEGRDFEVTAAQRSGGCAVFAFKGIDTLEAARELVGAWVFLRREELPPPGEDEYFVADLVGCSVIGADGGLIGLVESVVSGPAHDWLSIRRPDGQEALLPVVSVFVREVDIAGRRIVVTPPEGWLDAG
jgi:16S rRNA processing protein RimM